VVQFDNEFAPQIYEEENYSDGARIAFAAKGWIVLSEVPPKQNNGARFIVLVKDKGTRDEQRMFYLQRMKGRSIFKLVCDYYINEVSEADINAIKTVFNKTVWEPDK
jgi:hypothetical protein